MPVKHISTMEEYNAVLETSKTKLVIMDFSADWWVMSDESSVVRIFDFWFLGRSRSRCVVYYVLDTWYLVQVQWQWLVHFAAPSVQAIWLPRSLHRERWLLDPFSLFKILFRLPERLFSLLQSDSFSNPAIYCNQKFRCGPCKFIGPIFDKMSDEMLEIEFIKVDVDEAEEIAAGESTLFASW